MEKPDLNRRNDEALAHVCERIRVTGSVKMWKTRQKYLCFTVYRTDRLFYFIYRLLSV